MVRCFAYYATRLTTESLITVHQTAGTVDSWPEVAELHWMKSACRRTFWQTASDQLLPIDRRSARDREPPESDCAGGLTPSYSGVG